MYLPKGKYCVYPRMVYRLAIVMPPPPPPHFWWPQMNFDRISRHFKSIRNFYFFDFVHKMAAGGHFGLQKITFDRISRHFRLICNFFICITKWLPAAILDGRKSLLIAFLAISDKYATFFFFTKWSPAAILDCQKNHFGSHFSPFQINTQHFFFLIIFHKMAVGGHFGWPKITSDQYATFFFNLFVQNGRRRSFWKSDLGHFGWPKITFNRISRHFRSIHNFFAPKTIGFFHYVL